MRLTAAFPVVVALGLTLVAERAHAQDAWVTEVRGYLEAGGEMFADQGFKPTHEIYTGSLNQAANESVTFELDGGMEYHVLGACDTDCSDLDIVLYDSSGNEIDSDLLEDDFPIVSVNPVRGATYRAEIRMATCSAEPCRWGVGIYGK